ncbi:MAG: tRNA (adenosine(37)-N6)-threonylcarbamoyltransferase complex ATPase subunit type 1 TsaE [Cytophagales bacterium]|nr:MAG: tRNA (adenosine(37)-N6)-threonylcarbamoyltransferase complex ATPase subunit type 1 TsaE [Cytophagales bacterium]
MELFCRDLSELSSIALKITSFINANKAVVCLFNGQMGAGKTTLIKAVCAVLGVIDNVSSPTFSIVNEYLTSKGASIYHFDFYRIKSEKEAYNIGVEEYFESGNLCFLEWASQIPSLLPTNHIEINISVLTDNQRVIKLTNHE